MKIFLVIEDRKDRSTILVTDSFKSYSLLDAVALVRNNILDGLHVMRRGGHEYLRRNRNYKEVSPIEAVSISFFGLFDAVNNPTKFITRKSTKQFWKAYQDSVYVRTLRGEVPIAIDGNTLTTEEHIKKVLASYRTYIFAAAKHFSVDPYLLGGILIDEIARISPFEDFLEMAATLSIQKDVSVGIAQVKIETARGLIRGDYYNPNTDDKQLSKAKIDSASRVHIYRYLSEKKHNVFFGAAKMRADIDKWSQFVDITNRPKIIATLYSLKDKPAHANPEPNERGAQIATEFYELAKEFLGEL